MMFRERSRIRLYSQPLAGPVLCGGVRRCAAGQWHCIHFDAREQLGVFVELMQCSPEVYAGVENMRAAHVKLGQHRPRRELMELMPQ